MRILHSGERQDLHSSERLILHAGCPKGSLFRLACGRNFLSGQWADFAFPPVNIFCIQANMHILPPGHNAIYALLLSLRVFLLVSLRAFSLRQSQSILQRAKQPPTYFCHSEPTSTNSSPLKQSPDHLIMVTRGYLFLSKIIA